MRGFAYCGDPLFIVGCISYAANRWLIKPHLASGVFHSYFNDFLLIPCALPPILWLHRRIGLRSHDEMPKWNEIAMHLLFWSILFEWIGPRVMTHAIGDIGDVLAYCLGTLLACLWWWRQRWFNL